MYGSLDISTSGMVAQRIRLTAISANLANQNTLENARGEYEPYRRREVMFATGNPNAISKAGRALGVQVARIHINQDALRWKHDPGNPHDTDGDGYIQVPDINSTLEQINAMDAVRAYEANVMAADATKSMMAQALRLLA